MIEGPGEDKIVESVVASHLARKYEVGYWRSEGEIDVVTKGGIGFEVKWRRDAKPSRVRIGGIKNVVTLSRDDFSRLNAHSIQEVLEDKLVKKRLREVRETKHIEIKVVRDITKLVEETYLKVIDIIMRNRKKIVSFSEVLNNGNGKTKHSRDEIVDTFISLLYLCNDQKIKLEQNKLYDEIFIKPYQSH